RDVGAASDSGPTVGVAGTDGAFTISGLLPGTYVVEAQSPVTSAFASTEVIVNGSDVAGVTLTLSEGATARGRMGLQSGSPPKGVRPSDMIVMSVPLEHRRAEMTGGPPPAVKDDWSFELHGLSGRGLIHAGTLRGDWQMKRVLREDVDVTDMPLDF